MSEEIQLFGKNFWHCFQISFLRVRTIFLRKTYTLENLDKINFFRSFWWTSLNSVPKIFGAGYQKFFLHFFLFSDFEQKTFLLFSKTSSALYSKLHSTCPEDNFKQTFWCKINFFHPFPTISAKQFCWTVLGGIFKTGLLTAKGIFWVRIRFRRYIISIILKHWVENYRLCDINFLARLSKLLFTCPMEKKFVLKN